MNLRCLPLGELDTNCYVLWDDKNNALILDPADEAGEILSLVQQEQLQVGAVVLTHVHFDHMLAAAEVCGVTGAPLCVGAGDTDATSDPIRNLSGLFSPSNPVAVAYDRVLREGERLAVGDMSFTVLETPGHTPGCLCLLIDDILFSGDTLFYGSIGRLDFPGGDARAMQSSLARLMDLPPDTTVYAGHGPATTIGREKHYNPYIR